MVKRRVIEVTETEAKGTVSMGLNETGACTLDAVEAPSLWVISMPQL